MRKTITVLSASVILVTGLVAGPVAFASAPWSLFGDAISVKQGVGSNPWAVQLRSDATVAPGFGGVDFDPPGGGLTFGDISTLSSDFNVSDDDCGGGSPRFQLNVDSDGDGDFDGNVFVHFGPSPSFTGCSAGWQNTGNLIGNEDVGRYDASQVGGSGFSTYSAVAAHMATLPDHRIMSIQLVVDGSWVFADSEQTILVDNVHIAYSDHDHTMTGRNAGP